MPLTPKRIVSVNPDPLQLHDIHPPLPAESTSGWAVWLALCAGVLLVGVLSYLIYRLKKRPAATTPPEKSTRNSLDQLADAPELSDDAYAAAISQCLRRYTQARTRIHATALSEHELYKQLHTQLEALDEDPTPLRRFAHTCEQARYTQIPLSPEQRESLHALALTVFEQIARHHERL